MKLAIIGGGAGGPTAAARARRLDEHAEILMFERGEQVSYAHCGLPYYIGGVIEDRDSLLVSNPERLRKRYRIETGKVVTRFDAENRLQTNVYIFEYQVGLFRLSHGSEL